MSEKPADRPKYQNVSSGDPEPKIFVIAKGEKFPRPGLETYFADINNDKAKENRAAYKGCSCDIVGVWCSCNKVLVSSRQAESTVRTSPGCGCVGHTSSEENSGGGGVITGCRCAPVH